MSPGLPMIRACAARPTSYQGGNRDGEDEGWPFLAARWGGTGKCQDCGWVEPGASYPSKESAEPNVDAGFGELGAARP